VSLSGGGAFGVWGVCANDKSVSIGSALETGKARDRAKKSFDFHKVSIDIK
jgi:hypothetical protein